MELRILGALIICHLAAPIPVDASSVRGSPLGTGRIVGGTDVVAGEWPWQISLIYNNQGNLNYICGGSLINSQWVMTSKSCFANDGNRSNYYVQLGAYQLQPTNTLHTYNTTSMVSINDIAMLKLSSPVTYTNDIMPIYLPSSTLSFPSGMECWITGWGDIRYNVNLPNPKTLQKVMVPLIDYKTCDAMYHINSGYASSVTLVPSSMICAGYAEGGKGPCQGDAGGPLMCKVNGVWYQAGVASSVEGCAQPNRPGVYTLVSAYLSLIKSMIPGLPTPPPPTVTKSGGNVNMSCYLLTLLLMAASVLRYL